MNSGKRNVHFGVSVPQIKRSWEETAAAALEFERLGFDSLWVNDHLYGPQSPNIPILEAWTTCAALAAITESCEIGTLVTPAGMRNPAHLGKIIATIDNISRGRIIPGLGAGWMEREFTDFGMEFPNIKNRLNQLEETIQLFLEMWDPEKEEVSFTGSFVKASHLVTQPKPMRTPPLLVGGAGEKRTIPLAAKYASIYNNVAGQQELLPRKIDVLKNACAAIGRDPNSITVSQQCLVTIAETETLAEPMIDRAAKIFGGHLGDPKGALALSGSPERIQKQIQKHLDLGCTMFVIEFFGRDTREPAKLFAETVIPSFR